MRTEPGQVRTGITTAFRTILFGSVHYAQETGTHCEAFYLEQFQFRNGSFIMLVSEMNIHAAVVS